ncbi:MAG: cytochrome b N-terminal domain-containing protein [Chloroflexota bacterium]
MARVPILTGQEDTPPEAALRRVGRWIEERTHVRDGILPIIQHPVPKMGKAGWWYVLGSATLVAFIVQVVSGVALAMTYVPDTKDVYQVLTFLSTRGTWGPIVRGIHYWGANAMVVLIGLHIMRVFLFGSYKYPRELNWLTGVALFALTIGMGFSGQLLRWDQDAYWAVVVGAEQAGKFPLIGSFLLKLLIAGDHVSGTTLTRFFATHVFLLPAMLFLLIGVHLSLVVFDGISEPPKAGDPVDPKTYKEKYHTLLETKGEPFFPDAAWRDAVMAVVVVAVIVGLAVVLGPKPLGPPADPTNILTYPRPDWYFVWYFAILALMPPAVENELIIGIPALIFILMFLVPFFSNHGERSPARRPWALALVGSIVIMVGALSIIGYEAPWSPVINAAVTVPIPADIQQRLTDGQIAGAQVFQEKACHTCHALEGQGGTRGPDLTHIADRYSREQMIARVENGAPNMPGFAGNITNSQLKDLVDFMETLRSNHGELAGGGA